MAIFDPKDLTEAYEDARRFGHSGGIVGMLRPAPTILDTHYMIPRKVYDALRVDERLLKTCESSAPETQARHDIMVTRNTYIVKEAPLYREPRTGDMECMLEDINRVEPTPYSKFKGLQGKIALMVKREFEKMALQAIRKGSFR